MKVDIIDVARALADNGVAGDAAGRVLFQLGGDNECTRRAIVAYARTSRRLEAVEKQDIRVSGVPYPVDINDTWFLNEQGC